MRRRWLLVPIVLGLLALAITGGAVMAQDGGSDSSSKTFAGRVAAILKLEESTVQDAFNQARSEAQEERLQSKLDRLVEAGEITQEQADQYMEWFRSRPEGILERLHHRSHSEFGSFGGHRSGGPGNQSMRLLGKIK